MKIFLFITLSLLLFSCEDETEGNELLGNWLYYERILEYPDTTIVMNADTISSKGINVYQKEGALMHYQFYLDDSLYYTVIEDQYTTDGDTLFIYTYQAYDDSVHNLKYFYKIDEDSLSLVSGNSNRNFVRVYDSYLEHLFELMP